MYICTLKGPGYHTQVNCRLKVNNWYWGVKFGLDVGKVMALGQSKF